MYLDIRSCNLGFLNNNNKAISKAIVFFERLRDRPYWYNPFKLGEATCSHVFGYEDAQSIIESHAILGVKKFPACIYDNKEIEIFEPLFINNVIKENMLSMLGYVVGETYGMSKMPLFVLDSVFKTFKFTKILGVTHFKVCSQLWAWAFYNVPTVITTQKELYEIAAGKFDHPKALKYEFGASWKTLTPDDMLDYVTGRTNEWSKVV